MAEVTKFIHRLCRKEEDPVGTVEVDPEELATLLQYMLITGVLQCIINAHFNTVCVAIIV